MKAKQIIYAITVFTIMGLALYVALLLSIMVSMKSVKWKAILKVGLRRGRVQNRESKNDLFKR